MSGVQLTRNQTLVGTEWSSLLFRAGVSDARRARIRPNPQGSALNPVESPKPMESLLVPTCHIAQTHAGEFTGSTRSPSTSSKPTLRPFASTRGRNRETPWREVPFLITPSGNTCSRTSQRGK